MTSPKESEVISSIEKLRELFIKRNEDMDSWILSDVNLYGFLKQHQFKVDTALQSIDKSIEWRKVNQIDGILDEMFSSLYCELLPFKVSVDKHGWPFAFGKLGKWNIKKLLAENQTPENILRYLLCFGESLECQLKKSYFQKIEADSSKIIIHHAGLAIYDFNGLSIGQFSSPTVVKILISFIQAAEAHYPRYDYKIFMINTNRVVRLLMKIIFPFFSKETIANFKFLGSDEEEWKRELQDFLDMEVIVEKLMRSSSKELQR